MSEVYMVKFNLDDTDNDAYHVSLTEAQKATLTKRFEQARAVAQQLRRLPGNPERRGRVTLNSYIQVERTNPELLAAMPEAGAFTAFHRSPKGTNFYEQGDNKNRLVSKVTNLANKHNYDWAEVRDETESE